MKLRNIFQKLELVIERLVRLAVILLLGAGAFLFADEVPNAFSPGDLVSANQLNANFSSLVASVTGLRQSVTAVENSVIVVENSVTAVENRVTATENSITALDSFTKMVEASTGAVGSVRASLLDESSFASATGDPPGFDASSSKWALADGRNISSSAYSTYSGQSNLPDLRGMFLRGINGSRGGSGDPDGNRPPGHYQADEFKWHNHNFDDEFNRLVRAEAKNTIGAATDNNDGGNREPDLFHTRHLLGKGGAETRPRNVAVYYYVRIN